MRRLILGVLLAALVGAWPAAAQEQRASIEGIVKDAQGAILPGVTVEVRSASGGVVSAVTDGVGHFRFPALSIGRYTVTAQLSGFKTTKVENLELLLGQIKTVDFTLQVAGVTEEVVVTGEAPLVDTRQSARATSIAREQIDLLPKGRDFMSLVTQAPGANNEAKSAGVMIDGATTGENRYIVDGAETGDLVYGGSGKTVLPDFVEEVQVKSSGYTAEYGGATGGVINVMTKSGTNNWRGNVLFYGESSALQGSPRQTLRLSLTDSNKAEYITYAKDTYSRWEPGMSIGGPVAKDKSWFFVAYQPTFQKYERTVTARADGSTESGTQKQPSQFLSANNTSQIGSNLRTRIAYNNSWSKRDGRLPSLDGSDPAGLQYTDGRTNPNYSLSGQADWVVKQNFFVSARAGYYQSNASTFNVPDGPRFVWRTSTIGMAGVPASLQKTTSAANVLTNGAIDYDKQQRTSAQIDATWYGRAAGQHTIKGGVQLDRLANSVNSYETGPYAQLYYATDGSQKYRSKTGTFGYYRFRVATVEPTRRGFSTTGDVSTNNVGLFIQDAWTVNNKLTVNLGLRTENETVPPFIPGLDLSTGYPAEGGVNNMPDIKFSFRNKLAPRLGFAYDVKGDGKWKAYGSWGIFYDIFKMNLSRGSFGGEKWQEYWYTLNTADWTHLLDPVGQGTCPPACPASMGTLIRGPYDYRAPGAVDPSILPMKSSELAFGMEHQVSPVVAVSASYVRKWLNRAVDDVGSFTEAGEVYLIANPGFGQTQIACPTDNGCNPAVPLPAAARTYDAVTLSFNKNLSHSYSLRVAYTWSRLYGNFSGLDQTDENGRQSPNTGRLYDYPLMSFKQDGTVADGVLATDRPHQVKAQFIYQLPIGTSLGLNEYVASGIPKTSEIAVIDGGAYPMFYKGRGDAGRMPIYSQTDLFVQHEFKVGARRIQASFNVINLFNQKTATNFFATENASGKTINFDEPSFYKGQVDFNKLKASGGWAADPRFMMNNGYQNPIQARFGLKFLF